MILHMVMVNLEKWSREGFWRGQMHRREAYAGLGRACILSSEEKKNISVDVLL